jgi:hypothetical protein
MEDNIEFMAHLIASEFKGEEFDDFWQKFVRVENALYKSYLKDATISELYQALVIAHDLIHEREEKEWEEEDKRLEEEDRLAEIEEERLEREWEENNPEG